jgi:predicted nucleotidyltransferase
MSRDEVLTKLRHHAPELQAEGILHLTLFGSTARNQTTPSSDIDLMADFDPGKKISLLSVVRLERELSEMLGEKVDLCTRRSMREIIRKNAEKEAVLAF